MDFRLPSIVIWVLWVRVASCLSIVRIISFSTECQAGSCTDARCFNFNTPNPLSVEATWGGKLALAEGISIARGVNNTGEADIVLDQLNTGVYNVHPSTQPSVLRRDDGVSIQFCVEGLSSGVSLSKLYLAFLGSTEDCRFKGDDEPQGRSPSQPPLEISSEEPSIAPEPDGNWIAPAPNPQTDESGGEDDEIEEGKTEEDSSGEASKPSSSPLAIEPTSSEIEESPDGGPVLMPPEQDSRSTGPPPEPEPALERQPAIEPEVALEPEPEREPEKGHIGGGADPLSLETITINETPLFYRVDCPGGEPFNDTFGRQWSPNDPLVVKGGRFVEIVRPQLRLVDTHYPHSMYDVHCFGNMFMDFDVDVGQTYEVHLHFAETHFTEPGDRVFDIVIEDEVVESRYDIVGDVGKHTAVIRTYLVHPKNDKLNVELKASVDHPLLSAVEVNPLISPSGHNFRHLNVKNLHDNSKTFEFFSPTTDYHIARVIFEEFGTDIAGEYFTLDMPGVVSLSGAEVDRHDVDVLFVAGKTFKMVATLAPLDIGEYGVRVLFCNQEDAVVGTITVRGTGDTSDDPYLHVVITGPSYVIDWDGDGKESARFYGGLSHTHEPGKSIVGFQWLEKVDGKSADLGVNATTLLRSYSLGKHDLALQISDDSNPRSSLIGDHAFSVVKPSEVPGVFAQFFLHQQTLPQEVPKINAESGTVLPNFRVHGGIPGTMNVLIHLKATIHLGPEHLPKGFQKVDFKLNSKRGYSLPYKVIVGNVGIAVGRNDIDLLVFLGKVDAGVPFELLMRVDDQPYRPIPPGIITHDQTQLGLIMNAIVPDKGSLQGGNTVRLDGVGWDTSNFAIKWGDSYIPKENILVDRITDNALYLTAPSAAGEQRLNVSVESPVGSRESNAKQFMYQEGFFSPRFGQHELETPGFEPTVSAWCYGKLYVGTLYGEILVMDFDDNYELKGQEVIRTLEECSHMNTVMGMACGLDGTAQDFKLYISHNKLFVNGGSPEGLNVTAPFLGAVSYLQAPDFSTLVPVIRNLGISNYDHVVNGLEFDNKGNLLIVSGSGTNAGVPGDRLGGLEECPTSAALLVAEIWREGFDGDMKYELRNDPPGVIPQIAALMAEFNVTDREEAAKDERFCKYLKIKSGDVRVMGAGLRNPLGVVYTTDDVIYTTENGPNAGLGAALRGKDIVGEEVGFGDELNIIEEDNYYGHPNPSRGWDDPRQFTYISPNDGPGDNWTQPAKLLPSSSNGIVEYRSETFGGAWKGDLIVQWYNNDQLHLDRRTDGSIVTNRNGGIPNVDDLPQTKALDVQMGPGGALFASSVGGKVFVNFPIDPREMDSTPVLLDVTPWRGFKTGGGSFYIAGYNFDRFTEGSLDVAFGSVKAEVLNVSPKRIEGVIPTVETVPNGLVDITVSGVLRETGHVVIVALERSFRFLERPSGAPAIATV